MVVGAMAPDFHYYFYLAPDAEVSHSLPGTFFYCLPAGLLVLWIFHALLKRPLISLFPQSQAQKLMALSGEFKFTPLSRTLLIVVSLLVGTLTHLLWDSFTHSGGWFVQEIPFLQTVVLPQIFRGRAVFSVLQHSSTVLGMAALLVSYWVWLRQAPSLALPPEMQLNRATRLWWLATMAVITLTLSGLYGWQKFSIYQRTSALVVGFAIGLITVTFAQLVVFSLWWRWTAAKRAGA